MRGIGAGVRIFDLLDRKPAIPPDTGVEVDPARRGPIRFEHVWFEYPSRRVQILKDLNLEVGVGESVAIVWVSLCSPRGSMLTTWVCSGQSGSGKSSINALLMRYYDPIKGKVTFDGQGEVEHSAASTRH